MADIINVNFDQQKPVLERKNSSKVYCHCSHYKIDEHLQTVSCSNCNKAFSAWEVLLSISKSFWRLQEREKSLKNKVEQKSKELEEIERRLRNAKASLRRLS